MDIDIFKRTGVKTNGVISFIESSVDDGFDYRWRQHPEPQVTTEEVFWEKTGWSKYAIAGKTILDAGSGCGRFSAIVARCGGRPICVDGSVHALRAAVENVAGGVFVHADLLDLPIKPKSVDAAFSIGVLHHTKDTREAFLKVAETVKIGGEFAVWVYAKPGDARTLVAIDFLHEITKACPPVALYEACKKYAVQLRDVGMPGALATVLRVSGSKNDEECISDTFDWHTPQYRYWHSPAEVASWFEEAGYEVTWRGAFPVCMRGKRVR